MSSEEPVRSVPDELFQQVTAKPGRQLPDALFGPPPARPARPEREEPIRSVPDELFKQVTARSERSLPDALFGPPPAPVAAEPEQVDSAASDSAAAGDSSEDSDADVDGEPATAGDAVADADAEAVADSAAQPDGAEAESAVAQSDTAESAVSVTELSGAASSAAAADDPVAATNSVAEPTAAQGLQSASASDGSGDPSADAHTAASAQPTSESVATATDESVASADSAVSATVTASVAEVSVPESLVAETAVAQAESLAETAAVAQGEPLAEAAVEVVLVEESTAPRPVESASPRPVLLVIADSLAYYGPKGGLPADDPRIWPNMVAAELDWDVELIARIGWTCRDAYWALIGDPRVWAAVPRAGAVVFAVGGMDTLPSPLPTALRELIRYIRPPKLRRGVRASYNWLQPKLSKLGRPVALPPKVSVDYLEQSREALNHLRPELPVVAVLPSVHKCDAYGRVHRGRARAVKALQAWSGRTSVPLVDLGEAVRDDIESGAANPDGIHWGWAGHAAVATAMTKALQEVR